MNNPSSDTEPDKYRDAAAQQLQDFNRKQNVNAPTARTSDGKPYESLTATLTTSQQGLPLLQDGECIGLLQNFVRKNIKARVVHGKGTGAHGYFQCTNPAMKNYSRAKLFQDVDAKTPIFIRFGLANNSQEADNGDRFFFAMSIKYYTEDGNLDILNVNNPVFTFRDPFNFASQNLSTFPPSKTQAALNDPNANWDYAIRRPEVVHRTIISFADRGLPYSVRTVYFPINVFRLTTEDGNWHYAKFEFKTNQGVKYLTGDQASEFKKADPDFIIRDLYNAIEAKDYPSWTWYMQVMDRDEPPKYLKKTGWSAFDVTKVWPHALFPRIKIGQIVVNRNPDNHFNEVESSAFNPGSLVPGIEASLEDKVFHGRLFAYHDAQMYRLGGNRSMIPVNQPREVQQPFKSYFKEGKMNYDTINQGGQPIYAPNRFNGPKVMEGAQKSTGQYFENMLDYHDTINDDNFSQPRIFYEKVIKEDERKRLAKNLAGSIGKATEKIQRGAIDLWGQVSPKLAADIENFIQEMK